MIEIKSTSEYNLSTDGECSISLKPSRTEDTKYRCIGAVEIQFSMHEPSYSEDETPSRSTIKRIIKWIMAPLLSVI
ncbi:MAG: hypothetical protein K8R25_10155 [Methanosarcinales archaeon]|nr:hypothetical protein [Methanosarcinales archaeon]